MHRDTYVVIVDYRAYMFNMLQSAIDFAMDHPSVVWRCEEYRSKIIARFTPSV